MSNKTKNNRSACDDYEEHDDNECGKTDQEDECDEEDGCSDPYDEQDLEEYMEEFRERRSEYESGGLKLVCSGDLGFDIGWEPGLEEVQAVC